MVVVVFRLQRPHALAVNKKLNGAGNFDAGIL
jgi:hypothetical protein